MIFIIVRKECPSVSFASKFLYMNNVQGCHINHGGPVFMLDRRHTLSKPLQPMGEKDVTNGVFCSVQVGFGNNKILLITPKVLH